MHSKSLLLSNLIAICIILSINCSKEEQNPEKDFITYSLSEGIIGKGGGTISLNDPNSNLNGVIVMIPESALEENTLIQVSQSNASTFFYKTPDDIVVSLQPHGTHFLKLVEVTIPYKGSNIEDAVVINYDPDNLNLEFFTPILRDSEKSVVTFETEHFSNFCAGDLVYEDEQYQSIKYKDSYRIKNDIEHYITSLPVPQYVYKQISSEYLGWYYDDSSYPKDGTPGAAVKKNTFAINIDGIPYDLYVYDHGDYQGCEIYNFMPISGQASTSDRKIDILKFINVLKAGNLIQPDQKYLSSITFGNEIWSGTGFSIINDFSVTLLKKSIIPTPTVTDRDGNSYNTVTIGSQTWMTENLRVTRLNDNTPIQLVTSNSSWASMTTPAYCWYNNDEAANKNIYGGLYNWYAVNTGKLCPSGWHVPSHQEFTVLRDYLGGATAAGGKLKEVGLTHWKSPNTGATDSSGFTAVPSGTRTGLTVHSSISERMDIIGAQLHITLEMLITGTLITVQQISLMVVP